MTAGDVDVVVLGLGIHGSSAVYELSRRGLRVVGIDQFEPGHSRGSSHGATRMIRRAYPSPAWNEFVQHAYRGWERWERDAGRSFMHRTGGAYAHRGVAVMQGGRVREVETDELATLLPALRIPEGYHAAYDPDAGVVEAEVSTRWAQDRAVELGAELRFREEVFGWDIADGVVTVRTARSQLRATRLIVAAGAFVRTLVPRFAHFFEVWRILTYSAPAGQERARAPHLGSFSVDHPGGLVFGLPEVAGAGAKLGVDAGKIWDPTIPVTPPSEDEIANLSSLLGTFVPDIDLTGGEATACLYTMTPDRRFVVGELPDQPEVLLAAACSGHGFKFGPAIGEAVADLVEHIDRPDLDFLSPSRVIAA